MLKRFVFQKLLRRSSIDNREGVKLKEKSFSFLTLSVFKELGEFLVEFVNGTANDRLGGFNVSLHQFVVESYSLLKVSVVALKHYVFVNPG
jgi:hypothetical protein